MEQDLENINVSDENTEQNAGTTEKSEEHRHVTVEYLQQSSNVKTQQQKDLLQKTIYNDRKPTQEYRYTDLSMRESFGASQSKFPQLSTGRPDLGRIPAAVLDEKRFTGRQHSVTSSRVKYPTRPYKITTVSVSNRKKSASENHMSNYVELPRNAGKVVTWDEAMNSRPPMQIDMDGPTPCTYTPRCKPPKETNTPAWTFGMKTFIEKPGGGRVSWEKSWFHTQDAWSNKTDFYHERRWPSPTKYQQQREPLKPLSIVANSCPNFTIGVRRYFRLNKEDGTENLGPNTYNREHSDGGIFKRAPAYSHSHRREGTLLWPSPEKTPGPGAYNPDTKPIFKHKPAFTIIGTRREKTHNYGPFATL